MIMPHQVNRQKVFKLHSAQPWFQLKQALLSPHTYLCGIITLQTLINCPASGLFCLIVLPASLPNCITVSSDGLQSSILFRKCLVNDMKV